MQFRMKNHQLTKEQVEDLLERSQDCVLATQGSDGFPYAIPMNFVYYNDEIYMHGLPKGQKIDNIKLNSKVCVEVHEMLGLLYEDIDVACDVACDVNVKYNSAIILGYASLLTDIGAKREILNRVVNKYTPQFSGEVLPENMVRGTGVIKVEIKECTGKYYK